MTAVGTPEPAAAPAAAPATPVPAATPAPPASAEQPKGPPRTREEAKQALRDARAAKAAEKPAAEKPAETPPAEEGKPAPAGEPAAEPKPGGAGEPETPPAEGEKKPLPEPQAITVEVPADHPATRGHGAQRFTFTDPVQAEVFRSMANGTYVRVKDNDRLRGELRSAREEIARRDAHDTAAEKFRGTPEFEARRTEIQRLQDGQRTRPALNGLGDPGELDHWGR